MLVCLAGLSAQDREKYFVGGFGGFSILGSDGNTMVSEEFSHTSSYKPETGPAAWLFAGRHFKEYFSVQASYGFNRNDLRLNESIFEDGDFQFYEQSRSADMHSVIGEALLYFRPRGSWYRPYLTLGGGVVHFRSGVGTITGVRGTLPAPGSFTDAVPAVRIAVGIDLFLKDGWAFRYSFSETISSNAIGDRLALPGIHRLQNFQNLFGFAKHF
jgi:hypothetical protein